MGLLTLAAWLAVMAVADPAGKTPVSEAFLSGNAPPASYPRPPGNEGRLFDALLELQRGHDGSDAARRMAAENVARLKKAFGRPPEHVVRRYLDGEPPLAASGAPAPPKLDAASSEGRILKAAPARQPADPAVAAFPGGLVPAGQDLRVSDFKPKGPYPRAGGAVEAAFIDPYAQRRRDHDRLMRDSNLTYAERAWTSWRRWFGYRAEDAALAASRAGEQAASAARDGSYVRYGWHLVRQRAYAAESWANGLTKDVLTDPAKAALEQTPLGAAYPISECAGSLDLSVCGAKTPEIALALFAGKAGKLAGSKLPLKTAGPAPDEAGGFLRRLAFWRETPKTLFKKYADRPTQTVRTQGGVVHWQQADIAARDVAVPASLEIPSEFWHASFRGVPRLELLRPNHEGVIWFAIRPDDVHVQYKLRTIDRKKATLLKARIDLREAEVEVIPFVPERFDPAYIAELKRRGKAAIWDPQKEHLVLIDASRIRPGA